MCRQSSRPSLGGEAGGRSLGFISLIFSSQVCGGVRCQSSEKLGYLSVAYEEPPARESQATGGDSMIGRVGRFGQRRTARARVQNERAFAETVPISIAIVARHAADMGGTAKRSPVGSRCLRARRATSGRCSDYATDVDISIGWTMEGSSFSGLLTRVEIGHIRIGSAGNGCIRSLGSGSSFSQGS